MAWEWSKVDEKGLARFVTAEAVRLVTLPINRQDLTHHSNNRRQVVEAIYNALAAKGVKYTPEKYHPSAALQPIRTPDEILKAPREGTCLDLAGLFCGLCLGNELLPLLVVIEGHALAAISLTHGLREWNALDRQERELFEHEPLTDPNRLRELVDSGAYLAIECTGFSQSKNLPESVPEGIGRTGDGLMPFDRAVTAGHEQLDCVDRPFRFAIDIAVAHYHWRIEGAMPQSEATRRPANKGSATNVLNQRLQRTLDLYLAKTFKDDQYARLDQASETDPDRSTLLRQVFVDLEVQPREGKQPRYLRRRQAALFEEPQHIVEAFFPREDKALLAMGCFLQEQWPKIVVIGGPGQGKSTLGQYLAQVHRAHLLKREEEVTQGSHEKSKTKEQKFKPTIARVPFRIVLKYFAQWLSDKPSVSTVEAYLAEQMKKDTSRRVSFEGIQDIVCAHPSLMIFDGLDEVIEPDLRDQLLTQVEAFLGRAEQLGANLQVFATSRPTGYSEQFDPEQFWHLELQPMSKEKVRDYAQRWVRTKVLVEEEQRRVLDTLEECLQEDHTRSLLTTPLQVTIVLLIIKDGGRPPAQREALFHEYWGTIFRREKAKAKGVIRTEESLLFDLHAYLGYVLHRRAAGKNVRSLLPAAEFESTVHSFLRGRDSRSPDDIVRQQAAQMVVEARDRLFLLVAPEPGFFGFELRSLQEFFAAAYLAQTARDTQQRFERLKAIARSEHWRNVSLFFAGRIVRNFGGEAANILELVCRPIDRNRPDCYLRRGAWLACDIAADGAFAANRDLQFSAVEYALTVLDTISIRKDEEHLQAALRRLSPEDRRDIFGPLLEQKLATLPSSCLVIALDAYGQFVGKDESFLRGLETLLASGRPECMRSALSLGFQHQAEPSWLAAQLENYWPAWGEKDGSVHLCHWWSQDPQYAETVLLAWSPSEARIRHLLPNLLHMGGYWGRGRPYRSLDWGLRHGLARSLSKLTDAPELPINQMITTLHCLLVLYMLVESSPPQYIERIEVGKTGGGIQFIDLDKFYNQQAALISKRVPSTQLEGLLARSDLMTPLRQCLWDLYWMSHEPNAARVAVFMEEIRTWTDNNIKSEDVMPFWLIRPWPLLRLAVERQSKGDSEAIKRLQPYLNKTQEIAISEQVRAAVRNLAQKASSQEWAEFVLNLSMGEMSALPELIPLAERLEMTGADLVRTYVVYWSGRERQKYSSTEIRRVFSAMEKALAQPQKRWPQLWPIMVGKWSLDQEMLTQGKRFLTAMIEHMPQQSEAIGWLIGLFLKLLATDQTTLALAPLLLSAIGNFPKITRELSSPLLAESLVDVPLTRLSKLTKYTSYTDDGVRQGALALWSRLVGSILHERYLLHYANASQWHKFRSLRFDWRIGLSLIGDADVTKKRQGITLLTLSDFPITDTACRTDLLTAMANAQETDDLEAWAQLLRQIPISQARKAVWQEVLESVLAQPRKYSSIILSAALERYATLVGEEGSPILGDETALGLPAVVKEGG
jgi:hypothetical protein